MSEQRNAERDREIIAEIEKAEGYSWGQITTAIEAFPHYLERAVAAEAEAEKWRIEAFKQNPTQDAYDAACTALEKHRTRADAAEQDAQKLEEEVSHLRNVLLGAEQVAKSAEQRVAELEKENRRLAGIEQALKDFEQPNGTATDVFMWLESTTNYDHNIDKALKGVE